MVSGRPECAGADGTYDWHRCDSVADRARTANLHRSHGYGFGRAGTGFVELQVNGNTYGGFVALAAGGTATLSIPAEGVPSPSTILPIAAGSCTTPGAPAPNTVGVLYSGDANYLPSTSAVCLAVGPSLSVSANPAVYGQALTYTATVDSFDTGTVSFLDGTAALTSSATIHSGQAQFAPALPVAVGNHAITAVFNGQTSNVVNVAVNKANTATALNVAQSGANVTLTASVSVAAPGGGTPTGTVQFFSGSVLLGSAPLSTSPQSRVSANLAVSNFAGSITAQYSGDANFNGSGSPTVSVNALLPPETRLTISSNLNSSMLGQAVTFTAAVSTQGLGTPGGTVEFLDGADRVGSDQRRQRIGHDIDSNGWLARHHGAIQRGQRVSGRVGIDGAGGEPNSKRAHSDGFGDASHFDPNGHTDRAGGAEAAGGGGGTDGANHIFVSVRRTALSDACRRPASWGSEREGAFAI